MLLKVLKQLLCYYLENPPILHLTGESENERESENQVMMRDCVVVDCVDDVDDDVDVV